MDWDEYEEDLQKFEKQSTNKSRGSGPQGRPPPAGKKGVSHKIVPEQQEPPVESPRYTPIAPGVVPDLDCFLCNRVFDLVDRKPYQIPCEHIACKECLQGYVKNKKTLVCPFDGTEVNNFHPKGGVRRHDDFFKALYVFEHSMSQQSKRSGSSMNLQTTLIPKMNSDNSIIFEDKTFGGVFEYPEEENPG